MAPALDTPVLLFLFNRPDTTAAVFDTLRRARPRHLLVVADGPRADRPGDAAGCTAARAATEGVDWDCRVERLYAPANMGIRARVDSGMAWAFERVEQLIILEDDCVPSPDFYGFCAAMLARYAHDDAVMSVSGSNFTFGRVCPVHSYFFSRYPITWGWATWRRAWRHYDPAMGAWPECRDARWLERLLETPAAVRYWSYVFRTNHATRENWDYAWIFSCWLCGGLGITPAVNLVSNAGFGVGATHTRDPRSKFSRMAAGTLDWPLRHPPSVARDAAADAVTELEAYGGPHFLEPMFRAARLALRASRSGAPDPQR